jgi:hypothetical protein
VAGLTAFLAPPRSQRPGQGPPSHHPKAGPAYDINAWLIRSSEQLRLLIPIIQREENFWNKSTCRKSFSCHIAVFHCSHHELRDDDTKRATFLLRVCCRKIKLSLWPTKCTTSKCNFKIKTLHLQRVSIFHRSSFLRPYISRQVSNRKNNGIRKIMLIRCNKVYTYCMVYDLPADVVCKVEKCSRCKVLIV